MMRVLDISRLIWMHFALTSLQKELVGMGQLQDLIKVYYFEPIWNIQFKTSIQSSAETKWVKKRYCSLR